MNNYVIWVDGVGQVIKTDNIMKAHKEYSYYTGEFQQDKPSLVYMYYNSKLIKSNDTDAIIETE
jgi:hypothetical protein